jgi:hypothetical protein
MAIISFQVCEYIRYPRRDKNPHTCHMIDVLILCLWYRVSEVTRPYNLKNKIHIFSSLVAGRLCVTYSITAIFTGKIALVEQRKNELRGLNLRPNYTYRATAACWRS